jgi:chromosome partitioning protein
MALPRVADGRCKLAVVGMRIDGRTRASQVLADWSQGLGLPYLGPLREAQLYVRSLERGLTLFDLPASQTAVDLAQWEPILEWMRPILQPAQAAKVRPIQTTASRVGHSRPDSLMPAQESLVHGSRLAVLSGARAAAAVHHVPVRTLARSTGEAAGIPRFLKRGA